MYKLRVYAKLGNFDHEEVFQTKEEMDNRYNESYTSCILYDYPTAWEFIEGKWYRMLGY